MAELTIRGPYMWKCAVAEKKVRVQNKKWTPPTHILPLVNIQRRMWKTANFPLLISLLFLYISLSQPLPGRQKSKNWNLSTLQCFTCFPSVSSTYLSLCVCVCACAHALSHVWLFMTPWTVACQAPWNCPGKSTGVKFHFLLQGIFLTQGLNPSFLCLLHWQADSLPLPYLGSPWTISNICLSTPEVTGSDEVNITSSFYVASVSPLDTVDLPVLKGTVTRKEDYRTFRGNQGRKNLVPRGY